MTRSCSRCSSVSFYLKASLYCFVVLLCSTSVLQDACAFAPISPTPGFLRNGKTAGQIFKQPQALGLYKQFRWPLQRLTHTCLGLRSSEQDGHEHQQGHVHKLSESHRRAPDTFTRRGVLVLTPLAALAFAGWQSKDNVAAETTKAKEKASAVLTPRPLRKELLDIRKELEKEKKLIGGDMDAGLKQLQEDLAEVEKEGSPDEDDVRAFKEKFEERRNAAMEDIQDAIREVDRSMVDEELRHEVKTIKDDYKKKKSDLIAELKSLADKAEDPQVKKILLSEAQDIKEQTLDNFSLKQWTADSVSDVKQRFLGVLLQNEETLRKVQELLPIDLLQEEVKGDSVVLSFPLFGGISTVKKTISLEQVAGAGLVAGSCGELIKDVVSFPLDTIRTRLMTQGSFESSANATESEDKKQDEQTAMAARTGRRALMLGEVVRGTQQVQRLRQGLFGFGKRPVPLTKRVGTSRLVKRFVRKAMVPDGLIRGVYKGVTAVLLASPLQGAAFFGAKELIKKAAPMYGLSAMQTFLAGIVVGDAVYWVVRCPAETIKTRVQTGVDANWIESLRSIVSSQGLGGLYKAYVPLLQLDFPFTAVNFALYSGIQGYVEAMNNAPPTVSEQFAIGFACSAFTAALTTPLNVATTRILMESGGGVESGHGAEEGQGAKARDRAGELQEELQEALERQQKAALALLSGKGSDQGEREEEGGERAVEAEEQGGLKTLLRAAAQPHSVQSEAVGASEASPRPRYETMWGTLQTVYREEGAGALAKGVLPRMAQLGLNHALRFSAYDAARTAMVKGFLEGSF